MSGVWFIGGEENSMRIFKFKRAIPHTGLLLLTRVAGAFSNRPVTLSPRIPQRHHGIECTTSGAFFIFRGGPVC